MPETFVPPVSSISSVSETNEPVSTTSTMATSSQAGNTDTTTVSSPQVPTSTSTSTTTTFTTANTQFPQSTVSSTTVSNSGTIGKKFHSIIRLDPFNGDIDSSFTFWLNKYEKFCDLNNITELERLNVFPFYLTSSALIYYNELPPQIKSNYTALKDALKERFESDSRYIDFSILSAKQESSETVESYLNRICKLASDKNIPERVLISICLNGLKPSLRKSVLLSQPKHFSELTKLARLAETSEKGLMNSIESSYEILIDQIKDLKTQISTPKQDNTINAVNEVNRYQNNIT